MILFRSKDLAEIRTDHSLALKTASVKETSGQVGSVPLSGQRAHPESHTALGVSSSGVSIISWKGTEIVSSLKMTPLIYVSQGRFLFCFVDFFHK